MDGAWFFQEGWDDMAKIVTTDFIRYFQGHKGKENAVYSREIERHFGMDGTEVRELVNYLRTQGIPICSGVQGYWIAKNDEEVMATLLNLMRRKKGLENAIEGMLNCIRVYEK